MMFRKLQKSISIKSKISDNQKNRALRIYLEFGPKLRIDRDKRLKGVFPEIDENVIFEWIKEFKAVDHQVSEFAYQNQVSKYNRKSFSVALKTIFPWLNARSLWDCWGLLRFYIIHEGWY